MWEAKQKEFDTRLLSGRMPVDIMAKGETPLYPGGWSSIAKDVGKIKTILVPLDSSRSAEAVLPYAEMIASCTGAALHLLTAVPEESARDEATTYLNRMATELRSRSLSSSIRVVPGDPADSIIAEANAQAADLIAVTAHGRSGPRRWVLGSVGQKVMHGTSRPLLIAREPDSVMGKPTRIGSILVALDGSDVSLGVLPYAEELAEALSASLVLYNAVPPLDIYPGMGMTAEEMGHSTEALFGQRQLFLADAAARIEARRKVETQSIVTIGFPVDEIVRVAEQAGAQIIAMATHGRSGVDRWAMGSVAEGVVRRSSLACLLVRPEGVSEQER
jgi:nucleotide-binding universal stress UspA family protein